MQPEPKRSVADAHDVTNKGQRPSLLIDLLTGDRSHSNKTGENSQSSGQQHTLSSSNVSHEMSETPKGNSPFTKSQINIKVCLIYIIIV